MNTQALKEGMLSGRPEERELSTRLLWQQTPTTGATPRPLHLAEFLQGKDSLRGEPWVGLSPADLSIYCLC